MKRLFPPPTPTEASQLTPRLDWIFALFFLTMFLHMGFDRTLQSLKIRRFSFKEMCPMLVIEPFLWFLLDLPVRATTWRVWLQIMGSDRKHNCQKSRNVVFLEDRCHLLTWLGPVLHTTVNDRSLFDLAGLLRALVITENLVVDG